MILCTLFISVAQLFYNAGAEQLPLIFWNWPLFAGIGLYALGAIFFVYSLKGGEVSVLYPIIGTSYIWVALLANVFFNEPLGIAKIIGIVGIVLGVSLLGFGHARPVYGVGLR